ncbi:unnamed protein product, partial [Prorocentrum cordatum]
MSEVLATGRGRSRTRGHLALAQRAGARQLASNARWARRHIEAHRNPSHYGCRQPHRRPKEARRGAGARLLDAGRPRAALLAAEGSPRVSQTCWGDGCLRPEAAALASRGSQRTDGPLATRSTPSGGLRAAWGFPPAPLGWASPSPTWWTFDWLDSGLAWGVALGTPCTRWSAASRARPVGAAGPAGLALARISVWELDVCARRGVHMVVEGPLASQVEQRQPFAKQLRRVKCARYRVDQFACAAAGGKPTTLSLNIEILETAARRCPGRRWAVVRQGQVHHPDGGWRWRTSVAAASPSVLCRAVATALWDAAPARARRGASRPGLEPRWRTRSSRQLAQVASDGAWRSRRTSGARSSTRMGADQHRDGLDLGTELSIRRARRHDVTEPGFLRKLVVAPTTRKKYERCYADVVRSVGRPPRKDANWDLALVNYIEGLYRAGEAATAARYAYHGVSFVNDWPRRSPDLLPKTRLSLLAFARSSPEHCRDPPAIELVLLMLDYFLGRAVGDNCQRMALVAAHGILSFDCYLRPSEGLDLTAGAVGRPRPGAAAQGWAINVAPAGEDAKPSKNRHFDASVLVGAHDRQWVCRVLELLVDNLQPGDRVFRSLRLADLEK